MCLLDAHAYLRSQIKMYFDKPKDAWPRDFHKSHRGFVAAI